MTAIELIQFLMQQPPNSEVLTVFFDPSGQSPPTVVGAGLYSLKPTAGDLDLLAMDPILFVGSPPEFELMAHLLSD